VLSGFDPVERAELPDVLMKATRAVLDVIERGLTPAMNTLNAAGKPPRNSPQKAGPKPPVQGPTSPQASAKPAKS
jgi:hypothetical protein